MLIHEYHETIRRSHLSIFFIQGSYIVLLKIFSYAAKPPPLFACLNFSLQIESSKHMSATQTPQIISKTSEDIVWSFLDFILNT